MTEVINLDEPKNKGGSTSVPQKAAIKNSQAGRYIQVNNDFDSAKLVQLKAQINATIIYD